jgi:hypothetical protein
MEKASNITSEEELLQLRDESKISEEEYQDLLGAMRKSMLIEPEEPATQVDKARSKRRLGKIAFYLMLTGIVVPIVIFFICFAITGGGEGDVIFKACFILCVLFEIAAFVFGVIFWSDVFGKATVVTISVLAVLFFALSLPVAIYNLAHQQQAKRQKQLMLTAQNKMLAQKQALAAKVVIELKSFPLDNTEGLITQSGVTIDKQISSDGNGSLRIEATEPTTVRLFETGDIDIEDARLIYQACVRTENVEGQVYLEMWCHIAGLGDSFSRGLDRPLTGSTEWVTEDTPFFLKAGQNPDNVKLNLVINGTGRVWIDDIRLLKGPLR